MSLIVELFSSVSPHTLYQIIRHKFMIRQHRNIIRKSNLLLHKITNNASKSQLPLTRIIKFFDKRSCPLLQSMGSHNSG